MLKPNERKALANWWDRAGYPMASGLVTGAAIAGIPWALFIGFSFN